MNPARSVYRFPSIAAAPMPRLIPGINQKDQAEQPGNNQSADSAKSSMPRLLPSPSKSTETPKTARPSHGWTPALLKRGQSSRLIADAFCLLLTALPLHRFGVLYPLILFGSVFGALAMAENFYRPPIRLVIGQELFLLLKIAVWSWLVAAIIETASSGIESLAQLTIAASVACFAMCWWRLALTTGLRDAAARNDASRNVLIVGAGQLGCRIAEEFSKQSSLCVVKGFLDDDQPCGGRVLGRLNRITAIARSQFIDEVIIAAPQSKEKMARLVREAKNNHLDLKVVPEMHGFDLPAASFAAAGDVATFAVHDESIPLFRLSLKRALDVSLAAAGLTLLAPFLACIAALIKLDSSGPIFYSAMRVGRKALPFPCYKFRTMICGADVQQEELRNQNERFGATFKLNGDHRITRVGRVLRKYSLDELPQLWNVLAGEMSMVGPRPHPLDDFLRYRLEDFRRLDVTPGITGLWQVTARKDPSFARNVELDDEYIRCWSLALDFKILFQTVSAVWQGSGV